MITPAVPVRWRGWGGVWALGLSTITAYGGWFYAFGVLIEPMSADTGWSKGSLGAVFSLSQVVFGVGAMAGGRMLDRVGARPVFVVQAVIGGGLLLVSSTVDSIWLFAATGGLGGGVLAAFGFYHITTATAARISPTTPAAAIGILTLIGAFCSPIYLPATAWLVERTDWRFTVRVLALCAIAGAVFAAAVVTGGRARTDEPDAESAVSRRSMRQSFVAALGQRSIRLMLLATAMSAFTYNAILVYQVPVMVAAGLPLGTAAAVGGFRGFCQIFGRLGINRAVDRFSARVMLIVAYGFGMAGVVMLPASGRLGFGLAYALLAGIAMGAMSPLQAIYGAELYEPRELGTLMGAQTTLIGLVGALGPIVFGLLADRQDNPMVGIPVVFAALLAAAVALTLSGRPHTSSA